MSSGAAVRLLIFSQSQMFWVIFVCTSEPHLLWRKPKYKNFYTTRHILVEKKKTLSIVFKGFYRISSDSFLLKEKNMNLESNSYLIKKNHKKYENKPDLLYKKVRTYTYYIDKRTVSIVLIAILPDSQTSFDCCSALIKPLRTYFAFSLNESSIIASNTSISCHFCSWPFPLIWETKFFK